MAAVTKCQRMLRGFIREDDAHLMFRAMWHFSSDSESELTPDIEQAVNILSPIKKQFLMISDPDFYQLCGIAACHVSGGGLQVPFVPARDSKNLFIDILDILSRLEQEKGHAGRRVKELKKKLQSCKDERQRESLKARRKYQSELGESIEPQMDAAIHCLLFAPRFCASTKNHVRLMKTYLWAAIAEAGYLIHIYADPVAINDINDMATMKGFLTDLHIC